MITPVSNIQDHTFLSSPLGPKSLVLDCGGFHGAFSAEIVDRFKCISHVLEPSPANFNRIPERSGIIKHQLALSLSEGEADFHLATSSICNSLKSIPMRERLETVRVRTTSLVAFLRQQRIERVDLLKLDIEGMEMDVLEALPTEALANIHQVTVEFHDPYIHPQGAERDRINALVRRFQQAGFHLVMPLRPIYFDALFVNVRSVGLKARHRLWLSVRFDIWGRLTRAIHRRWSAFRTAQ